MKKQLAVALLLLLCMFTTGCGKQTTGNQTTGSDDREATTLTDLESMMDSEMKDNEQLLEDPIVAETEETQTEEMQTVGTETFGYISIPSTWVKFKDLDGGTDFQYSNIDGTAIVTMNLFDDAGLSEDQKADLDAKTAASSVWMNLEANGVTDIEGASVMLGNYEAYQVYGAFSSEDQGLASFIVCWIFEDENGNFHYISAEAPMESVMDVVSYVEKSYTLSGEE